VATRSDAAVDEVKQQTAMQLAEAMHASDPARIRERVAHGQRCFAVWVGQSIAAYGWVSMGVERIGELETTFHIPRDDAYIWECATLEPYRRQGLYGALLRHMVATLAAEGLQRLWIGASVRNLPSIKGFAAAGFQPVAQVIYVRCFSLRRLWVSGYASAPSTLVAVARQALRGPRHRVQDLVLR
jgi:ribosomal protein S18 acetylase RimI-like enzyme